MNWKMLLEKKIKAPYVPELDSKTDTNHFSADFT